MTLPDNNVLDILISLVLIYALLSILVSILLEWWNHKTKARAKFLRKAIFQLLKDPLNLHYGELFYGHYLIEGFKNRELKTLPQYISSKLFAEVLIDIVANRRLHHNPVKVSGHSAQIGKQYQMVDETSNLNVEDRFKKEVSSMNPSPFADTLKSFCQKSHGFDNLKELLSFWYDDYMDRVGGWYKTSQRTKLIVFGFLVAIGLNVDSLHLLKMISMDDNLRNNLVQTADKVADQYYELSDSAKLKTQELEKLLRETFPDSVFHKDKKKWGIQLKKFAPFNDSAQSQLDTLLVTDSLQREYRQRVDRILNISAALNIPIGWDKTIAPLIWIGKPTNLEVVPNEIKRDNHHAILAYTNERNQRQLKNFILYILGIIISGISLSFGAPFWFETLVKLVNIRRSGKKPKATNEKSK